MHHHSRRQDRQEGRDGRCEDAVRRRDDRGSGARLCGGGCAPVADAAAGCTQHVLLHHLHRRQTAYPVGLGRRVPPLGRARALARAVGYRVRGRMPGLGEELVVPEVGQERKRAYDAGRDQRDGDWSTVGVRPSQVQLRVVQGREEAGEGAGEGRRGRQGQIRQGASSRHGRRYRDFGRGETLPSDSGDAMQHGGRDGDQGDVGKDHDVVAQKGCAGLDQESVEHDCKSVVVVG
mmetsp:Transcript_20155/g.48077  ORF Transcript_20155/g.48077 Transcript_20155/m.48077 type:complete len:234 (+) Transcript_20155:321-1022(+)